MDHFHSNIGAMSLLEQADAQPNDLLKFVYGGSLVAVCGMVMIIFFNRGPFVIAGILAYLMSLSTMTIAVKGVFVNQHFSFPKFVTGTHFFSCGVLCFGIMYYKQMTGQKKLAVPTMKMFTNMILPISVGFAASVGVNNVALMHSSASFAEMVGGAAPLFIIGICMAEGKQFSIKLLLPVLAVVTGVCACATGELNFTFMGFFLLMLATFLRAFKSHLQHQIMEDETTEKLEPIELLAWMSPPCFALMVIWGGLTEGFAAPIAMLTGDKGLDICMAIGVTIVNACVLNVANNFVIRDLGAVGCLLAGQLKGILVLMGSAVLLGEVIQMQQLAGYSAIAGGVYFYNKAEKEVKEEKAVSAAKDTQDLEKTPLVK